MKLIIFTLFISSISSMSIDRSPKIMGGTDADIHEFPFIVALIYNYYQQCGGTLLSPFWVLTAAHCEFPIGVNFWIEYGAAELELAGENARKSFPELFITHEKWDWDTITNDIAVIKLKEPAMTGMNQPFVKLASPGSYYQTWTPAVVAGWGLWSYENYTQPPLQKLDTNVWHFSDCRDAYKEFVTEDDLVIYPTNICAGVRDFARAHCSGDSGGPLFVNGIQVGIVSWSVKPCTVAQYPGVYTSVSNFIDWISEKTGIGFQMETYMIGKV